MLSPNPLRNDQWISFANLIPGTKHTGGLAMFIIIILTVSIQMKGILGTWLAVPEYGHIALKRPSQTPLKQ